MIKKHNISYLLVVSLAAAFLHPILFFIIELLQTIISNKSVSLMWEGYINYLPLVLLSIVAFVSLTFLSGICLVLIHLVIRFYKLTEFWYKLLLILPFYIILFLINDFLFESDYEYHYFSMCLAYTFTVFYFHPKR